MAVTSPCYPAEGAAATLFPYPTDGKGLGNQHLAGGLLYSSGPIRDILAGFRGAAPSFFQMV